MDGSISLVVNSGDVIPLNVVVQPIALNVVPQPIQLTVAPTPINLTVTPNPIQLNFSSTVQGPAGRDGAGAATFGSYVAGENITSSSLTHISEIDGKIYLADFEEDRPANSFTIAGCLEGATLSVLRSGLLYGLAGIVPGKQYWLGNVGQVRTTIPDHGVTQGVGTGSSGTEMMVSILEDIDWE